jgi:hypothetical protein
MKKYRATFKAKDGSMQRVTLQAKNQEEAEKAALYHQFRREGRFDLTFDRLQQSHERGDLTKEQYDREVARREQDRARYEGKGLTLQKVEEVKS